MGSGSAVRATSPNWKGIFEPMLFQRLAVLLILLAAPILSGCQTLALLEMPRSRTARDFARAIRVLSVQQSSLTWDVISGPPAGVALSSGTVSMSGPEEIIVRSRETVSTEFFLEVTLPPNFGTTQHLPYIGLDPYPIAPTTGSQLWGMNSLGKKIRVDGQSETYSAGPGDRIAMEARAGVVRYYKNYSGPSSTPFYISKLPPIAPSASFPITLLKPIGGTVGDQWVALNIKLLP
jgi:hypothetical protein